MAKGSITSVSVVGLGKLGLSLAAVLADSGFAVRGVELDKAKVDAINSGHSPIYEPGLEELVKKVSKRLSASTKFSGKIAPTQVTFVVVPTPSEESGAFSTKLVERAMNSIGGELRGKKDYHLVVLTSTVGPGSMDGVVKPTLEKASGKTVGREVGLCYNPEFIALGDVIKGLREPDFILIGESDEKAGDLLVSVQKAVCRNSPPFERMEFANAELAKIAVNSFVTMKMSFANTLAEIAENLHGGNVDKITAAVGRDRRIGSAYLKGATGYGGTCLVEGTMVQTSQGLKPIEEVGPGESVLSHDGGFHRVTRCFSRDYFGRVITITPTGGIPVTVTPEHPVLSSSRVQDERLRYLDLPVRKGTDGYARDGHRLRSMTGLKLSPLSWRVAGEVKHGDLVSYPVPHFPKSNILVLDMHPYHRKQKRSKIPLLLPLTSDIARLVGYYLSEGSTWEKEIRFSIHRQEKALVEDITKIFRGLGYKGRFKRKSENGVDLVFECAPLARFLRATFGSKASLKRLPASWLGLEEGLREQILRGIMYGDGSTSKSQYTLGITSRQLANQVYLFLLSFGVAASSQIHPPYRGKDGVFHNESYFVRVRHTREIEKLQRFLPLMPIDCSQVSDVKSIWIEDGLLLRTVRRVFSSTYKGRVYNLEVDGSNSYCSEGVILHNCFPRDNVAFAHYATQLGAQALIAEATHKVNLGQPQRLVALIKKAGASKTTRIGVLGLSFKPNTNIVEQSQALMLSERLVREGYRVTVFDPAALESAKSVLKDSVTYARSAEELVNGNDLIVLATPWPEFRKIPGELFKGKSVFDSWRFFGDEVRRVSKYSSIGTA